MSGYIRRLIQSSPFTSLILFFCFSILLSGFFVSWRRTEGVSMYPSLSPGSILACTKSANGKPLNNGDCVVADLSYWEDGLVVVKRIAGCPGDRIQVVDGVFYRNGVKESALPIIENAGVARQEIVLGNDEYFLLGDNPGYSLDSRDFGPVPAECITNIVIFHIF